MVKYCRLACVIGTLLCSSLAKGAQGTTVYSDVPTYVVGGGACVGTTMRLAWNTGRPFVCQNSAWVDVFGLGLSLKWSEIDKTISSIGDITTRTHSLLTSLTADDHTQYALLAGRAGTNAFTGSISATSTLKTDADVQLGAQAATDTYLYYGKSGNANTFHLARAGVGDALSFDASRNATFAGNVDVPYGNATVGSSGMGSGALQVQLWGNQSANGDIGYLTFRNVQGAPGVSKLAAALTARRSGNNYGGTLALGTTDTSGNFADRMTINDAGAVNIPGLTASRAVATDGSSNLVSIPMPAYSMQAAVFLESTLVDAATVYWGPANVNGVVSTYPTAKFIVPRTGVIREVYLFTYAAGTAGSNESWSSYIRYDDTTDNLIASVTSTGPERIFSNTNMNVAVTAGHHFAVKQVYPTWATNPSNMFRSIIILIEPN